jgi:hypothetical protein
MSVTFLQIATISLFICLMVSAAATFFGVLRFEDSDWGAVLNLSLLFLFLLSLKLWREVSKFSTTSILPRRFMSYSLKQLLYFVTVIAFLAGLAWYVPFIATTALVTFVCRSLSTFRSLQNAIQDSLEWSALATLLFLVFCLLFARLPQGAIDVCLSLVLGALVGGVLSEFGRLNTRSIT